MRRPDEAGFADIRGAPPVVTRPALKCQKLPVITRPNRSRSLAAISLDDHWPTWLSSAPHDIGSAHTP